MDVQITRKLLGCDGGPCPAVWETTDPDMLGVQGSKIPRADLAAIPEDVPSHETVILVPRSLLDRWAREQS